MLILEARNIKKNYGEQFILEFDDLKVYSGNKIGIVGQNGSGKTTLLNILSGEIQPDEGIVRRLCDITYIRQFSEEDIDADKKLIREFGLVQKADQKVFSGGEQTRIKIANAFSQNSLMVFADEPTSNLDYRGVTLLMEKLSRVESFFLISHDRFLLDSLCNRILEVKDGGIRLYSGNYSDYRQQSELERRNAAVEYEKYQAEKEKLENAISNRSTKSVSIRKTPKRMGNSEARLHRRAASEKQEKIHNAVSSLKTRLEKLEVKEKPRGLPGIKLDFSLTNPPENKVIIHGRNLSFCYGEKKIFENTGFDVPNHSKTALWGENGTGKTTLLNLIHNRSAAEIKIVPQAILGYFHQGFENLDYQKSVLENVMQDSVQSESVARTILARLLISGDAVYKKVRVLSGGERIKVSFAKLFVSRANVLLLDEPTNYLDMPSIEALEEVLKTYQGTVIFVSHDSAFVNSVADRLLVLDNCQITTFEGKLEEYRANRNRESSAEENKMKRMALSMKITEIIARMSDPKADKEALEAEYELLITQLKQLD
jgi:macrolide transport system ATP-binding/permease protein